MPADPCARTREGSHAGPGHRAGAKLGRGGRKPRRSDGCHAGRMARTNLQIRADEHAAELRRVLAQDLRRMRDDAGCTRAAIAALAGVDPSFITRIESRDIDPTLETYARVAAALGANLAAKVYPDTGPSVRDRHQVRAAECSARVAPPALACDARGGRPPAGPRLGRCRPSRPGGRAGGGHGDRVAPPPARAAAPVESREGRGTSILARVGLVVSDGPAGDLQAPGRALDANQPGGCPRRPQVAGGRLPGGSARRARRAHGDGGMARPGAAVGAPRGARRGRPRSMAAVKRGPGGRDACSPCGRWPNRADGGRDTTA